MLPSPSSRSRCAAGPRAVSSSSPRAPPSSTSRFRTAASACDSTLAVRSSFAPVAPTGVGQVASTFPGMRGKSPFFDKAYHPGGAYNQFAVVGALGQARTRPQKGAANFPRDFSEGERSTFVPGPIEPSGLSTRARPNGKLQVCSGAAEKHPECLHLHHPNAHPRAAGTPTGRSFFQQDRSRFTSTPVSRRNLLDFPCTRFYRMQPRRAGLGSRRDAHVLQVAPKPDIPSFDTFQPLSQLQLSTSSSGSSRHRGAA